MNGIHNIKTGIQYDHTFLTEKDAFGIVDPTLNPVCLNADGSPFTDPSLTNPAGCTGLLQPNPNFVPQLGCIDLTRTGTLPGSDGCPNSTAALYQLPRPRRHQGTGPVLPGQHHRSQLVFQPRAARRLLQWPRLPPNRLEPRLGIAYNIKPTNTVLRVSYARTLETPFNENLVISSLGCNDATVNALMSTLGHL